MLKKCYKNKKKKEESETFRHIYSVSQLPLAWMQRGRHECSRVEFLPNAVQNLASMYCISGSVSRAKKIFVKYMYYMNIRHVIYIYTYVLYIYQL